MLKTSLEGKSCLVCGKVITNKTNKFCSKKCKSLSQVRRITLVCFGCGKKFQVHPHRKRKTNYCSMRCYWDSTRTGETRLCKVCGRKFVATGSQIRKGFGIYCSRKCQHKTYPKRVKRVCPRCSNVYWVCPSWSKYRIFCSKKCKDDSSRDYVSSVCRRCDRKFELPRSDLNRGRGNFCTFRCFLKYRGSSTLEEKLEKALRIAGIGFEREVKFKRFHVDFLIRKFNLVIECDGEYWHTMPRIQERDRRKEKLLENLGYEVLRFSGKTIDRYSEHQLAENVEALLSKRFSSKSLIQNLQVD